MTSDTENVEELAVEKTPQTEEPSGFTITPRWELALYGGLLVVAGVMRLWDLGVRAIHHDESLHALYSWNLYTGRGYQHDPMMHGPFQFHGNATVFFLFGDGDYTARLLPALFGIFLVFMPYFLRHRLGQIGSLVVATLLAFSPAMLYFSRFARNDIFMAVWSFGLVIVLWRYIDERKNRYLYLMAALLALAFSTKETAYIIVFVLGSFLFFWALPEIFSLLRGKLKLSQLSAPGVLLLLLFTLTLPLWSAAISLFQDSLGIVLASSEFGTGPIGVPSGWGLLVAAGVGVLFILIAAALGLIWNRRVWLGCAAIFYTIWALLYTTFFTNLVGLGSGMWQSMGYWVVQQEVRRGGQPWYYYFVIGSIYEFLPLLFGVIALVFYVRKGDLFRVFLVYWAVLTFVLYTMAGEKMPWLLVNLTLPVIALAGTYIGDIVTSIPWRRLAAQGGLFLIPGVILFLMFLWRVAFFQLKSSDVLNILSFSLIVAFLLALIGGAQYLSRRIGGQSVLGFSALVLAVFLFALTVRVSLLASYKNGDVPVEMLVYTQSSPDIPRIARDIERVAKLTGEGKELLITVDSTDGYSWPWAWYLRNYTKVGYPCYSNDAGCAALKATPDSVVVVVSARNQGSVSTFLEEKYANGLYIKHRWWFPEVYRDLTLDKLWEAFKDRKEWRKAADYFLYRKLESDLGSVDAYVYFSQDLPMLTSP